MTRAISPYVLLELAPGADRAAIDEAYYRLIKLHHPDRSGDDGTRAAEINFAYTKLKRLDERSKEVALAAVAARRGTEARPRVRWTPIVPLGVLVAAGVAVLALFGPGQFDEMASEPGKPAVIAPKMAGQARPKPPPDLLKGEPDPALIAHGMAVATTLLGRQGLAEAQQRSAQCLSKLDQVLDPGLFDRCVAFDETVVALTRFTGFASAAEALARRDGAAARAMSSDPGTIKRRRELIRGEVGGLLGQRGGSA